jgi:hypothetical protein
VAATNFHYNEGLGTMKFEGQIGPNVQIGVFNGWSSYRDLTYSQGSKSIFTAVCEIQETIFILVLIID